MLCSYLLGSVTVYAEAALSLIVRMRTSGIETALSKCYWVSMHRNSHKRHMQAI